MHAQSSIFLIGPMGAGKSTVGQQLSIFLNKTFVDSDVLIAQQRQLSIPQIFAQYGLDYFRDQEAACLAKVTRIPNIVLATGGGCVEDIATRKILRKHGIVVYLMVSPHEQQRRLREVVDRPLWLSGVDLKYRESVYLELANVVVATDHKSVQQVVALVVTELENLNAYYPS